MLTSLGDFNGDDLLDAADLEQLTREVSVMDGDPIFDIDRSGSVDFADR